MIYACIVIQTLVLNKTLRTVCNTGLNTGIERSYLRILFTKKRSHENPSKNKKKRRRRRSRIEKKPPRRFRMYYARRTYTNNTYGNLTGVYIILRLISYICWTSYIHVGWQFMVFSRRIREANRIRARALVCASCEKVSWPTHRRSDLDGTRRRLKNGREKKRKPPPPLETTKRRQQVKARSASRAHQ